MEFVDRIHSFVSKAQANPKNLRKQKQFKTRIKNKQLFKIDFLIEPRKLDPSIKKRLYSRLSKCKFKKITNISLIYRK